MRCGALALTRMKGWVLFFGLWGVLGGCTSIKSPSSAEQTGLEFDCATGDVTPHEAMVWMKTTGPQEVKVQYTSDPLWSTFQETLLVPTIPEQDFTAHIPLTNLTPKTRYVYRSLVPGKRPGRPCRFVTAPLEEDSATVTFLIGVREVL